MQVELVILSWNHSTFLAVKSFRPIFPLKTLELFLKKSQYYTLLFVEAFYNNWIKNQSNLALL